MESKQKRNQRIKSGLCGYCGKEPLFTKTRCYECNEAHSESTRHHRGLEEWRPGGPGKPPTSSYKKQPDNGVPEDEQFR